MKRKIEGNYVVIPDKYWTLGLDIYETNILARIMSWQRRGERFFESYESIADKFNMSRITAKRKFESLEKHGFIKRNGKVKRTWSWKADELAISNKIDMLLKVTNNERNVSESNNISNSELHYKNTKNINKNILRVDEEKDSSSPNKQDLELFAKTIDI